MNTIITTQFHVLSAWKVIYMYTIITIQFHVLIAWKAIRNEFPNTIIKGCAFHFGQAVWRKVQELGLRTTYSKRGPEYRYIRSLMALPFLPWADIQPAFDRLSARAASPELQQLVGYIDSNWIGSPVWQPRNWSIFQTNVRTNNDVEGKLLIST